MIEKTWQSFVPTLEKVLTHFNPRRVYEWGPGESTKIMSAHPSVELIRSIEHDKGYYDKMKAQHLPKVELHYNDLLGGYQRVLFKLSEPLYDLIFVDGRMRVQCMTQAKSMLSPNGLVILHDAERERYYKGIALYKYVHFVDNGWTACMTNEKDVSDRLTDLLKAGRFVIHGQP